MNPWQGDPIRAALANAREASGKPLLIVAPGGMPATERAWYEARGMDVFSETDIVLEAIGALLTPLAPAAPAIEPSHVPALPARPLTEPESLALAARLRRPRRADDRVHNVRSKRARRQRMLAGRSC